MSETYYVQDPLPGMGRELDILNGYTCPWHAEFMAEEGTCRCLENLGRGE